MASDHFIYTIFSGEGNRKLDVNRDYLSIEVKIRVYFFVLIVVLVDSTEFFSLITLASTYEKIQILLAGKMI